MLTILILAIPMLLILMLAKPMLAILMLAILMLTIIMLVYHHLKSLINLKFCYLPMHQVDRLKSKHIRIQNLTKFIGRLLCLWCPQKSWRSLLSTFIAPKIVKNGSEMRKLWPFKVCMVKRLKKCHTQHQETVLKTPKQFLYVVLLP